MPQEMPQISFEPQAMEGIVSEETTGLSPDITESPFKTNILTSKPAKKKTRENLKLLEQLTGETFNL